MYQNVLRTDPYRWLGDLATPVTLIRAPAGMRGDTMDFSQSPTWTGLGPYLGAVRDELWEANSHFIPMEDPARIAALLRSEEHTSELPSLMRISYAVFCLKKK